MKKKNKMVRRPSGSLKETNWESPGDSPNPNANGEEAEIHKGLCANCANRSTCLLPRSEGGVWHCEEYVEDV